MNKKATLWGISFYSLTLLFITIWFFGLSKLQIQVPDGLDGNHAIYHSMSIKQWIFSFGLYLPQIHGGEGALRDALGSEFIIGNLLHVILPTVPAYLINEVVTRSLAFWGMFLILPLLGARNLLSVSLTSLMVSLLPFWHFGYAAQAGLLFYSYILIKLVQTARYKKWAPILFTYPLYSPLFLGFNYYFVGLFISGVILKRRQALISAFLVLFLLGIFHLFTDWRLLYTTFLNDTFEIHKVWHFKGWNALQWEPFKNIFWIHYQWQNYHSHALANQILVWLHAPVNLLILGKLFLTKRINSTETSILLISAYMIGTSIISTSLTILGLDSPFDFTRLFFPNQVLWYVFLGLFLECIFQFWKSKSLLIGKALIIAVSLAQTYVILVNGFPGRSIRANELSFHEFYSTELFSRLKKDLAEINYKVARVISVGMHPSVALYNGFSTVDGYLWNYNKPYKFKFLNLWKDDFERTDEKTHRYILGEGGRLYFLHPAVRNTGRRNRFPSFSRYIPRLREDQLNLNQALVEQMQLNLILSNRVKFTQPESSGFTYLGPYGSEEGPYLIHVYIRTGQI